MRLFRRSVFRQWLVTLVIAVPSVLAWGCTKTEPVTDATTTEAPTPGKPAVSDTEEIDTQLARGEQLYQRHCLACHGAEGDGNGLAAAFLYPRPRNFQRAEFRLVTTNNRAPSDADLLSVLERGMPGSAMLPFAHLPMEDRKALVDYVRHLSAEGIRQELVAEAAEFGEEPDPIQLKETIRRRTQPSDPLAVPALPARTANAVARGEQIYQSSCATCHGKTGKGDGVEVQIDSEGRPTQPRDLTRGIFKGPPTTEDLYARIRLGMPGTPMPSDVSLSDDQVADLIHYLLSLSSKEVREQAVMRRSTVTVQRVAETITAEPSASVWDGIEPIRLTMTPLWWRDYEDLDVDVQAARDDRVLALRLRWRDSTRNEHAVRLQDFEDMAAVQFYRGSPEPFLGMGAADEPVDVWLWRAAWQADQQDFVDVNTSYPEMSVDWYPLEDGNGKSSSHATRLQPREFLTALAAGNLQSEHQRQTAAGNLEAGGFGSLTMRPRVSQAVTASGESDGEFWTVVLLRSLAVGPDAGIAIDSGKKLSVAFAVWDGQASDRNGQKRVTIWHDLKLE